jgi:hypothetical protein
MKGEVILRILAQESLKSKLRLRRYGEKNFRDQFVISKKWLGLIWNYFSNSRAFMKICGLRVDIQEVQGPFCKVAGIKEFPDLIYNGKFCGPSPRCGGSAARSDPRWTAGATDTGHSGALPVHGARALGFAGAHRRGATGRWGHGELDGLLIGARAAVWRPGDGGEERRRLELIVRVKEGAKGLGREGKRCGEVRGWCSPFIGVEGAPGRGGRGVTVALIIFNAIEDGKVKGRVKEGVLMAGRVRREAAIQGTELGGMGWPSTAGFDSGAAGVGRHGVGDGTDSWGPHGRER